MKYLALWSLGYKIIFEKFVKPSGLSSYILHSLTSVEKVELLDVHTGQQLKFDYQFRQLCKKKKKKKKTRQEITQFYQNLQVYGSSKQKILKKAFITSYFLYFPLTWMFYIQTWNIAII